MDNKPYQHLEAALGKIDSAQLKANDRVLLRWFVARSLTPAEACRYVLNRVDEESKTKTLDDSLLSLKRDLELLALKSTSAIQPGSI